MLNVSFVKADFLCVFLSQCHSAPSHYFSLVLSFWFAHNPKISLLIIFFILIPWAHSPLVYNASFSFLPCLVFQVFFSVPVSLDFFYVFTLRPKYLLFCLTLKWIPEPVPSLSSRTGTGSGIHLTCGPRGGVGVHMEQTSRSKCLPWSGIKPCNSHLAVQHATTRPPFN